jgi:hypothetical protein
VAGLNRWWASEPDERFWLETTNRSDIGRDLNAPQADETGRENWSYALVREVADGDVVLHYSKRASAIVAWSRATGGVWEDAVTWAARGASSRGVVVPYDRPGWRHGLDGPFELDPVTLDELRTREAVIARVRDELEATHGRGPLYFPFALSERRPLRLTQSYLTKFPAGLLDVLPRLGELRDQSSEATRAATTPRPPVDTEFGTDYRREDEDAATSKRDPFEVDPDKVDRGLRGHAKTQNALADALDAAGLAARSHRPSEPNFDLAWEEEGAVCVAEVKSLTRKNEERQLRLGLGQVLRYRDLLARGGRDARAVLAVERKPTDATWAELCDRLEVQLVWPDTFDRLFA